MAAKTTEDNCSICLDSVSNNCDRTVVRLRCSHVFHLDCIGSAFNASGVMQCPNCRQYENGTWRRFRNSRLEEIIDEETVDDEEEEEEEDDDDGDDDDDDDDDDEVQQSNPRRRYEYRMAFVHNRMRRVLTHRHQGVNNRRSEPLTPTEASPSHVMRHPLPSGAELSAQDEANMEPVGHLFDLDQGGSNDPVFQRTQPFSNSSSAHVFAAVATGSSSNGDVLVDSPIGLSRRDRNGYDYYDFLSPAPAAALVSMATRSIREFRAGFRRNGANGLPVACPGFPSSSTSEPTRNVSNVASMNTTSQNEPQAAIHSAHALEEIDAIPTSEYLSSEMDPSSVSHE